MCLFIMNSRSNETSSKNSLTPRIRIGLSRNRKATNKEFKSPMLQKELTSPVECVSDQEDKRERLRGIREPLSSDYTLSTSSATNLTNTSNEESSCANNHMNSIHTTPVLQSKKRKRHLVGPISNKFNKELTSPAEHVPKDTSELLPNDSTNSTQIYAKARGCNRQNETDSVCTTPVPQSKKKCHSMKRKSCDFKSPALQERALSSADVNEENRHNVCEVVRGDCTSTTYTDNTPHVDETDSICTTPISHSKKRGSKKQFYPDEKEATHQNDFVNESENKDAKRIVMINKSVASESIEVREGRTTKDVVSQRNNLENQNKEYFDKITISKDNTTLNERSLKSKNSKPTRRTLSLKQSSNSSNSDLIDSDDEFSLSLAVIRNKLRATPSDGSKTVIMSPKPNPDEVSRSIESNLSQDEMLDNYSSAELVEKILKLEDLVKDKKDNIDKLQQVIKYKSLHKVSHLKETTAVWKNGCQDALRDLLLKLREHKPIDMPQLLANMKIPKSMITFDVDTDCFL